MPVRKEKERRSFLKKRTEKLLTLEASWGDA
jgi:hypothetical protein